MRSVPALVESDACSPTLYDPAVLPKRKVTVLRASGEKEACGSQVLSRDPRCDGFAGGLGDLELHRPLSLALHNDRTRGHDAALDTSRTRSDTRSQPRSLLSIARLNKSRSRALSASCSRIRSDQISFGFSGGFWPSRRHVFQAFRGVRMSMPFRKKGTRCSLRLDPDPRQPSELDSADRRTARVGASPSVQREARLASALITLASMAKPSPPTSPSFMQRRSTDSNRWRKASLWRKRPCRFFEKVEWSGTRCSRSSRQNQR